MKIAIHQPEHFPYVGFFQKMAAVDLFVILDNVKFAKNSFQNRNRFLNTSGSVEWFTVPIPRLEKSKLLRDVKVDSSTQWKRKIIAKIRQNLGLELGEIYEPALLCEINLRSIEYSRKALSITTPMLRASALGLSGKKSELLANIVRAVGATTYVSGVGGKRYLDLTWFTGISVEFLEPRVSDHYSALYHIAKGKSVRRRS